MKTDAGAGLRPFSLDVPVGSSPIKSSLGRLFSRFQRPVERLLWLEDLNHLYAQACGSGSHREFLRIILERLHTRARVGAGDLKNIPAAGPVVVVANHPFGALEGIMIGHVLSAVRPDVKVMANYLLHRIPELRELFIFVDPFGGPKSAQANLRGMRQAIDWLDDGGMLAVFPSGTVSHLDLKTRQTTDPVWSDTVARMVRRTGAAVVPMFFEGGNSALFQIAGLVHPMLRTAMLPRELFRKRRSTIDLHVGRVISASKLRMFGSDREMTEHLRRRTYLLHYRHQRAADQEAEHRAGIADGAEQPAAIVPAVDPAVLCREIAALPAQCVLVETGEHRVIAASAGQIPAALQEIGRLREMTFRLTGEGTGRAIDLDRFDPHYLHLFVWNVQSSQIVSAYRLGLTDRILAEHGPSGLYTTTLFRYKAKMLRMLDPAIELGRSFVRPECQRGYGPLMLLWKGIGQIIARDLRYRRLFGPVSISNTYGTISRQLMVAFLQAHNFLPDLARLVRPRNPFEVKAEPSFAPSDVDEVATLISEIESDQKGLPVLLRQYLKLGGRMIGFNLDRQFSDVVDGLAYLDLMRTDRRILEKYMGGESAGAFVQHHLRT